MEEELTPLRMAEIAESDRIQREVLGKKKPGFAFPIMILPSKEALRERRRKEDPVYAARRKERLKKWRAANVDKCRAYRLKWRHANLEQARKQERASRAKARRREKEAKGS